MLKLSEAMRKGIECSEPTTGIFIALGNNGTCEACALGAALLGYAQCDVKTLLEESYIRLKESPSSIASYGSAKNMLKEYGVDLNKLVKQPIPSWYDKESYPLDAIGGMVVMLNDQAAWTREQIADWLESIGY